MRREVEWEQVWADYDARQPTAPPPSVAQPHSRPVAAAAPRSRRDLAWLLARHRLALAALVLPVGLAWLLAPGVTAIQVSSALQRSDPAAIARHVDGVSIQASLRDSLARSVVMPADGAAASFLGAMADEIASAWASPAAIAQVAQVRGVTPGGAERLMRAQMVGLTSFDLSFGDGHAPLTLRFEMTEPGLAPRWQVTGVRAEATPQPMAAAAPFPSMR